MKAEKRGVILDLDTFKADELNLDALLSLPVDWQVYGMTTPAELEQRIHGCEVILTNKVVLNRSSIKGASCLEYIGVLATGVNNIDIQTAASSGITYTNVAGYGTPSVVQHTLMLMLNLATNFIGYQKSVGQGGWQAADTFCLLDKPINELADKHLLILGHGELGKAVEKLALAFGMRVTVATRPGRKPTALRPAFDEVLAEADFVSLHCLLSGETEGLINEQRLAAMKPTSFLVNTARGALVDESALLDALQRGEIAGAAIDVMVTEPPSKDNELLAAKLPNLIVTPHNAWASIESRQRLLNIAARNLKNWLEG